ncbi:DUF1403 family protein [Mesorhizobium sp. M0208]|uniref:DUF1403 family protein n=1 Tax=Mesorhizobium sp. M0208 TaxID=2956916 RepID=UPI0033387E2F
MILRPEPSPRHHAQSPGLRLSAPATPVPSWLRRAVDSARTVEDAAIAAGAAIGALDAVVRRQERWAGVWRQRLALSAAAVTARQTGRVEDEAALRDAVLFARPGDILSGSTTLGPAGLWLVAWRRLAGRPAEGLLTKKTLAAVLDEFGHAHDEEVVSSLVDEFRQLGASAGTVEMLTGAVAAALRHGFGSGVGAWLADALLAQRLGWVHAVPLLGAEQVFGTGAARPRRAASGIAASEPDSGRAKGLLAAQARAALRAIDLSVELERRADRLLAIAPKLRAKGADAIVQQLLSDDALVASRGDKKAAMSDRGLRRLFDRLVDLGAVRELSGRLTFRIYGL